MLLIRGQLQQLRGPEGACQCFVALWGEWMGWRCDCPIVLQLVGEEATRHAMLLVCFPLHMERRMI